MPPKVTPDSSKNWSRKASISDNRTSVASEETGSRYARSTASTTAKITQRHPIHTAPPKTTARGANLGASASSSNTVREQQLSNSESSFSSVRPIKRKRRKQLERLEQGSSAAENSINAYPADHEPTSENIESTCSISHIPDPRTHRQYPRVDYFNPNGTQIDISSLPDTAHLEILSSIRDSICETRRELIKTPNKQHPESLPSEKTYSDDIDINLPSIELFVWEETLEDSHILPDSNNNTNSISCTEIASSLPQLCSSVASSASNSIYGTDVTGGFKYNTRGPTSIESKSSVEEPDDEYLKFEDLLTERMRYKTRIESGSLIFCAGKLCLF